MRWLTSGNTLTATEEELYRFIVEQIASVPHLEALLLLWNSRPRVWSGPELAARIFVNPAGLAPITADLSRRNLIALHENAGQYSYLSSPESDRIMDAVDRAYRSDLIRVTTTIHSKGTPGMREFARAFEFNRREKS